MLGRIKRTLRKQRRGAMSTVDRQSGDSTTSIIAPGMTITGDCETEGTVRIEGRIEGKIRAGKSVVVGRDAQIVGDILTHDAIIVGRVSGSITAESRVELRADCNIEGEIRSPKVQMDEGARFNGQLHMEDPAKAPGEGEGEGDRETKKRKNQQQRKRPSGQDQRGEHEVGHLKNDEGDNGVDAGDSEDAAASQLVNKGPQPRSHMSPPPRSSSRRSE